MWHDGWKVELNELRSGIDKLDSAIINLVSQRMRLSERIGEIKSEQGLPFCVPQREAEVIRKRQGLGILHGLSEKFVRILFKVIMHESRRRQKELVKV